MIAIYHRSIKKPEWETPEQFAANSWVYVVNPTDEELKKLVADFKLDAGHLKDALDPFEAPRLEIEDEAIYVFSRFPIKQEDRVATIPMTFIAAPEATITVCKVELPFMEALKKNPQVFTTQQTKLFLQIFQQINLAYQRQLTEINRQIHRISGHIENLTKEEVIQFVYFEGMLNDFLTSLVPQAGIFNKLLGGKIFTLYEPDKDLTEDLSLNNDQLAELAKTNLKTIIGIREAHTTITTGTLNRVIKLLTAMTIILTVPVIITGFYGMNMALPFADSPLAFAGIAAAALIVSLLLVMLFIKNKWL